MTYLYFAIEMIMFLLFLSSLGKNRRIVNKYLIFSCVLWVIVFGLRGYDVGNDTPSYAAFYENRGIPGVGYGTVDYPGDTIEWGFVVIARLLHFFSESATFFFLSVVSMLFFFIYNIYKVNSKSNPIWCLLIFTITGMTLFSLISMVRQSLSICVMLSSIFMFLYYYRNKGVFGKIKRRFIFLIAIALAVFSVFVHRTSGIIFPLLLLLFLWRNNRKVSYIVILASFVLSIFVSDFSSTLMDTALTAIGGMSNENVALLASRYEGTTGDTSGMSLVRALSYVLPLIVTIRYSSEEEIKSFFFKCMLAAFACMLLFSTSFMMNRLSMTFLVLGMCKFVPQAAMKPSSKLFVFYLLATIYYLWRAYEGYGKWPNTDSTIPYYFFWQ